MTLKSCFFREGWPSSYWGFFGSLWTSVRTTSLVLTDSRCLQHFARMTPLKSSSSTFKVGPLAKIYCGWLKVIGDLVLCIGGGVNFFFSMCSGGGAHEMRRSAPAFKYKCVELLQCGRCVHEMKAADLFLIYLFFSVPRERPAAPPRLPVPGFHTIEEI